MPHTYILYSQSLDSYYVGSTRESSAERLYKHNTHHKGFTASVNDWKLVYEEFYHTYNEAFARERKIKSWKSRKMIEALVGG